MRSHCTAAGCVPPLELNAILSVTFAPTAPELEESEIDGSAHARVPSATVRPINSTIVQNLNPEFPFRSPTWNREYIQSPPLPCFLWCLIPSRPVRHQETARLRRPRKGRS